MTRLLFVDDEPRVLQGLRQVLRSKRDVWQMAFAGGGTEALAELEKEPFDAVISDMRMPGMDGAELLRRVRELQPGALRIVLSGQTDEGAAVRAAAVAHRFLAKPCEPRALIGTLDRALELRARLSSDDMRRCIGGMAGLPSLPASHAALARALGDERCQVDAIAAIVEADVAMSAKALQLVNSAFFGLPRHVASVTTAVRYLGLNALRNLLLADALFQELAGDDVDLLAAEQSKSLLAARFARGFALTGREADVATSAALFHNVGRLALIALRRSEHAEQLQLGVTHAEVGAYLLGLWGLPDEVMEAVATYPDALLRQPPSLDASSVACIAQLLAREALGEHGVMGPAETLRALGVEGLVRRLQAEWAAAGEGR